MIKKFTVSDVINIVVFYNGFTEEKLSELGVKVRWRIKKAIDLFLADAKRFEDFRNSEIQKIRDEYFTEEKSFETIQNDDKTKTVRIVKDEYKDEYEKALNGLSASLEEILKEEHEYEYRGFDVDEFIDNLSDDTTLTFDDLNNLDIIFNEKRRDEL